MLTNPSIDKLLKKVDSRYSLVILASKRAHELAEGSKPLLSHYQTTKPLTKAFEEIAAGAVTIDKHKKDKPDVQ
ncbi:DNA-directed RNA polymerase subunit omega [Philodulcilactobacillus myokoensis]|uniref:DNA-directed RNA polymerase subunit omega n=1 Tax=Philodulcilactobacillus myokoensis TaxID=2929573 RepID=A0A9W6EST6_9LACO|nr:DNA-directed RNA polymerase subunit omega [Philodulcilactobacillus myokoensis]GLB46807.1 DNA-directed RNA polymerase subunit omega [Philodulcilactobacillus myokoensis]